MLPFVSSGSPVISTSEIPIVEEITTSGTPIDNPFEIKANYPPTLLSPERDAIVSDTTPNFDWSTVSGSDKYNIQVSRYLDFSTSYIDVEVDDSHYTSSSSLIQGTWYWRVRTRHLSMFWGDWSSCRSFIIDSISPVISSLGVTPETPDDDDTPVFHCSVTDVNGLSSVDLHFRINGGYWESETMGWSFEDTYEYMISVLSYGTFVEYYFTAYDNAVPSNNIIDNNGGSYYNFTIGSSDVSGPVITNIVHSQDPIDTDLVNITCTVTDLNGVETVTLYYKINNNTWTNITMTLVSGNIYGASIGPFTAGAVVSYYIVAVDDSPNHNSVTENNSGAFYSFTIVTPTTKIPLYYFLPLLAVFSLAVLIRKRK